MENKKLYNIILPIWLLIYVPKVWLITMPANFVIDSVVLFVAMNLLKVEKVKENFSKCIFKVWIFGFLADFVGVIFMMIGAFGFFNQGQSKIGEALRWNPFDNPIAFIWTLISVTIAGVSIYFLDKKFALRGLNMEESIKNKIAIVMAIVTAPYVMFIPTNAFINH